MNFENKIIDELKQLGVEYCRLDFTNDYGKNA